METVLAIIEVKDGNTFDNTFPRLLAYLGIVIQTHRTAGEPNTTIYGMCSDGVRYKFVWVDNDSLVPCSTTYRVLHELQNVFSFLLKILKPVQQSTPFFSTPTKSSILSLELGDP
ncbi:hypothetical protein Q9L58_008228 [Maublancomyces gigas]|uniref:Uncharacterized protein n=1 Tax=Discina gigas TaxID=1032678 RepID=A0ABR3GAA3_9PEZI